MNIFQEALVKARQVYPKPLAAREDDIGQAMAWLSWHGKSKEVRSDAEAIAHNVWYWNDKRARSTPYNDSMVDATIIAAIALGFPIVVKQCENRIRGMYGTEEVQRFERTYIGIAPAKPGGRPPGT